MSGYLLDSYRNPICYWWLWIPFDFIQWWMVKWIGEWVRGLMDRTRRMLQFSVMVNKLFVASWVVFTVVKRVSWSCAASTLFPLSVLQNASGDPAVSSTVNPLSTKRSKVKTEAEGPLPISPSSQVGESNSGYESLNAMSLFQLSHSKPGSNIFFLNIYLICIDLFLAP